MFSLFSLPLSLSFFLYLHDTLFFIVAVYNRPPAVFPRRCLLPTDVGWSPIKLSGRESRVTDWVFPGVGSSQARTCESQQLQLYSDGLRWKH